MYFGLESRRIVKDLDEFSGKSLLQGPRALENRDFLCYIIVTKRNQGTLDHPWSL